MIENDPTLSPSDRAGDLQWFMAERSPVRVRGPEIALVSRDCDDDRSRSRRRYRRAGDHARCDGMARVMGSVVLSEAGVPEPCRCYCHSDTYSVALRWLASAS